MSVLENIRIGRATINHIDLIAPLFDAYRQFYDQKPDLDLALRFIRERLDKDESVIFLATAERSGETAGMGFTQLYPTFCSVKAQNVWVLYDLFVAPEARRSGIGRKLMNEARKMAEESGAAWVGLSTAITNKQAQALYEQLGYEREEEFYDYFLTF